MSMNSLPLPTHFLVLTEITRPFSINLTKTTYAINNAYVYYFIIPIHNIV